MKTGPRKEKRMAKTSKPSLPTAAKPQVTSTHPTTEEIALRAYLIYLERGGAPGDALDDWTRAERELLQEAGKSRGKPGPKLVAA
jgi:hypothetical protein